ncbi:MAG: hypothetical protein WCN98_19360, partial [Verrucomicrobiaceae bacterium]
MRVIHGFGNVQIPSRRWCREVRPSNRTNHRHACHRPTTALNSHVNLIPTRSHGTHEAGFRNGIFEAVRAFMETRSLTPKGVKLIAEDLWSRACFTLSARVVRTQFHGQTKEKLTTRYAAKLVELCTKDAYELWLNQHPED